MMGRNTNRKGKVGRFGRSAPLPRDPLPDISSDPDMIRLKELLGSLTPDRRAAAMEYLMEGPGDDDNATDQDMANRD